MAVKRDRWIYQCIGVDFDTSCKQTLLPCLPSKYNGSYRLWLKLNLSLLVRAHVSFQILTYCC